MEIEVQGMSEIIKKNLRQQVKMQKQKLEEMKKVYKRMDQEYQENRSRENLYGGSEVINNGGDSFERKEWESACQSDQARRIVV